MLARDNQSRYTKLLAYMQASPYLLGMTLVQKLPERWVTNIFRTVADYIAQRDNITAALRSNLAHVVGTTPQEVPQQLIQDSLRSYLRYWSEVFRLPVLDRDDVSHRTEVDHLEHIEPILLGKGPGIMVLPHSGNWDMAGVWAVHKYRGLATVNERLKPEVLFHKFVQFRESLGFTVFASDSSPFKALEEYLHNNGIVCLLADRIVGTDHNNTEKTNNAGQLVRAQVNFFDAPVVVTTGPARLAMSTGAPLHAVFPSYTETGWHLAISPQISVADGIRAASQEIMDFFAHNISQKPHDWHAMQRIWQDEGDKRG